LVVPLGHVRRSLQTAGLVVALCLGAGSVADPAAGAEAVCDGEFICIHEERGGAKIRLLAENRTNFPLTYSMRVKTYNLAASGPSKFTRTLPAGSSEVAFELSPTARRAHQEARYRFFYDWTVGDKDAVHDDSYLYTFPYAQGQSYRVIQGYGSRFSHTGLEQFAIDFRMREGTAVHAARGGIVARVEERHSRGCWEDGCGRYANFVVVLHADGTTGEYYHLQQHGALVEVGERVTAGQKIALSGNTGHTTIPHLHFAVYRAADWGTTQSVPVQFLSADGVIDQPRRGGRYQATMKTRALPDVALGLTDLNSPASE